MSEKKHSNTWIAFAVAGAAVCVAVYFVMTRPDSAQTSGDSSGEAVAAKNDVGTGPVPSTDLPRKIINRPGVSKPERESIIVLDVAQSAAQLHQGDSDATEDLAILQDLVSYYRRIHGANPEGGLNFEIVGNLAGNNERKLAVLPPDHASLNQEGELLDRWGTPYWFHPISRELMEIVSAGPDKNLWTEDDVRID